MFLLGLVEYDGTSKSYVPVGEDEYNSYLQKKAVGKTMKSVRQVMLKALTENNDETPIRISKPIVRAVTIVELQPMVSGYRNEEINYDMMVRHYSLVEIFLDFPWFMLSYALTFLAVGIFIGFFLKKWVHKIELTHVVNWAAETVAHEREEYFRECPGGLERFVKLDAKRRRKYGYSETDPMNAYDLSPGESGEEENPMEVDEKELPPVAASAAIAHGLSNAPSGGPGGEPPTDAAAGAGGARSDSNTREYLESLPGFPFSDREPPVLPVVGVDWNDFDQIYAHMPVGQPDMCWDYCGWWIQRERHGFSVFTHIVVHAHHQSNWGTFVEQWFIHQDY
eukprot:s4552_g2.t1